MCVCLCKSNSSTYIAHINVVCLRAPLNESSGDSSLAPKPLCILSGGEHGVSLENMVCVFVEACMCIHSQPSCSHWPGVTVGLCYRRSPRVSHSPRPTETQRCSHVTAWERQTSGSSVPYSRCARELKTVQSPSNNPDTIHCSMLSAINLRLQSTTDEKCL